MKSNENNDYSFSLATETENILQKHGIHLNKNLGQNYLIDDYKRKKIIDFANISKNDTILEIGPGIGTLTIELSKKAKKIVAIEQDKKIFEILSERIEKENISNIELINDDALNVGISTFSKSNKIVSNLPYQISSPITFKFLKFDFDLAILMYQKEFANRMIAKVGDKNYSRLSAMLYFKTSIEFLYNVSPQSFIPQPKIDSSIIKLTPIKNESFFSNKTNERDYSMICRAIFPHKNKKIRNALIDSRNTLGYSDKKILRGLLDSSPELESFLIKRVVKTSPEEILELTNLIKPILGDNFSNKF